MVSVIRKFAAAPHPQAAVCEQSGAEMRFRVKEYIVRNSSVSSLPKNIRQVGKVDLDKRVYIEDYAFSYIKELAPADDEEGKVGVLLGEEITAGQDNYIFVRGAMEVTNASVSEGKVIFTEETWPSVKGGRNMYFGGMDIVGWFLVSSVIRPEKNAALERVHIDSFGRYKILLDVNPAEQTEEMYSCFDGGLEALDGYIVYFDKNEEMQAYMSAIHHEPRTVKADDMAAKRYRQLMHENKKEPKARQQLSIMYALSAILVILVLVVGVGRLQAEKNMETESESTAQKGDYVDNKAPVNGTLPQIEDETLNVGYANGNLTPTQPEPDTTQPETPEPDTTEPVTTQPEPTETEPETTQPEPETTQPEPETTQPQHRVYVIQQGDTLSDILIREYGDMSRLQELLDLNGITDGGNSINVGDELLLP